MPTGAALPTWPDFSEALGCAEARGGYAWWYLEAHELIEQRYGLTLIFFVGSVFSPTYAARLRRGENATGRMYPAVNLALYERSGRRQSPTEQRLWVMNEYSAARLEQSAARLQINQSFLEYQSDGGLLIELREDTTRFFSRSGEPVALTVRLRPGPPFMAPLTLGRSADGAVHYWQPLNLCGQAEVELRCGPLRIRYNGTAYADRNFGSGALHHAFSRWSWAHGVAESTEKNSEPAALVLYRAERRDGGVTGIVVTRSQQDPNALPVVVRSDENSSSEVAGFFDRGTYLLPVPAKFGVKNASSEKLKDGFLEDTPFYARYLTRLHDGKTSYSGVAEYLDLLRFESRAVQRLLTYKIKKEVP